MNKTLIAYRVYRVYSVIKEISETFLPTKDFERMTHSGVRRRRNTRRSDVRCRSWRAMWVAECDLHRPVGHLHEVGGARSGR